MKAVWNNQVIAEADTQDLIYIEGNWYFPRQSVKKEMLLDSDTPYVCPWKGSCTYYSITAEGKINKDAAFSYLHPLPGAIKIVKKDFSDYIAFWQGVEVVE